MTANEKQIGGDHYKKHAIQPWDYIIANNLGYLEGCAIKYISRWKDKGGIKDIEKAIHFLEKLKETFYEQENKAKIIYGHDVLEPYKISQEEYETFFGKPYGSK